MSDETSRGWASSLGPYSDQELRLFQAFGCQDMTRYLRPIEIYNTMVQKAFLGNLTGSHVEALRRAYRAISDCSPHRMTPEFGALLDFEEGEGR